MIQRYWLLAMVLLSGAVAAQTRPGRPSRPAEVPARGQQPTVLRNAPAEEAAVARPLPLSRQDYENCPNPRRYGPKARSKKMVRIW